MGLRHARWEDKEVEESRVLERLHLKSILGAYSRPSGILISPPISLLSLHLYINIDLGSSLILRVAPVPTLDARTLPVEGRHPKLTAPGSIGIWTGRNGR